MAQKETGKRRSSRIPIDYYKGRDDLRKARRILVWLALAVSVVWLGSGIRIRAGRITESPASLYRYSPGPLASVHQAWNERCEACHREFSPIDSKKWAPPFISTAADSDVSCKSCHQGPEHHPSQKKEDVKACAGCHFDHRGADNSLVKLADSECVSCHSNLSQHIASGKESSGTKNVITSFGSDHPPFSTEDAKAKDQGRLKFNHALHLSPGLSHKAGDRDVKTLAYLTDPLARERYRLAGQKDDTPIQLDCRSCHVTDASDFVGVDKINGLPKSATLPSRTNGQEMLPITYENQCKACHSLSFDGRNPELVAPHRAQPEAIRQFLFATYAGVFVANDQKAVRNLTPNRPIPGQRLERSESSVKQEIEKAVNAAEKVLFGGKTTCFECHYPTKTNAKGLPEAIEIPNVPELWLEKSRFNHTSHRAVSCRDCHVKAEGSPQASDILIPGIASCRECHSTPPSQGLVASFLSSSSETKGGVRSDCTTCHRYHHADKPRLGRGSSTEKGTSEHDFGRFLSGQSTK